MTDIPSRRSFFTNLLVACLAALGLRPRGRVATSVVPPAADGTYIVTAMASDGQTTSSHPFTWQVSPSRISNAGTKQT